MAKQIQDAYIVAAARTPVGKAPRGMFRNVRPDDLLAHVLKSALAQVPGLDPAAIDDVIVGCAMPEAEQGMNVARIGLLLAGFPEYRVGHDHQPLLLLGRAGGGAGRRPHPPGRGRRDDRRRHREHEHGADGRQQAVVQPGDVREERERRHRLRHGHHRGEGGRAVEGQPRGAGPVRRGKPPPRAARHRQRRVQGRDHAVSPSASSCPTWRRARSRSSRARSTHDEGPRRDTSPEGAGQAAGRRSPPRAASPPATARRCRTARRRWC